MHLEEGRKTPTVWVDDGNLNVDMVSITTPDLVETNLNISFAGNLLSQRYIKCKSFYIL